MSRYYAAGAAAPPELVPTLAAMLQDLYLPSLLRQYCAGALSTLSSTLEPETAEQTKTEIQAMSLEIAINNLAVSIAALAAAGGVPSNVTNISAGKETPAKSTPAAKDTPAKETPAKAGGNTAALEKARAAAKAKREAEAAAKEEQDELALLGGGEEEAAQETVTLQQLRDVGMKIIKAKKGKELKDALVESFGVESLTALDEEHYADALPIIEAILD